MLRLLVCCLFAGSPAFAQTSAQQMDNEVIRMREYVDLRIADLKETQLARDQVNEQRIQLAAVEVARRLEILNHAHEQALEAQAATVPRELFEAVVERLNDRISALEKVAWGLVAVIAFVGAGFPLAAKLMALNRATRRG